MSDVKVEGYKSQASEILAALAAVFEGYNDAEKAAQIKKVALLRLAPHIRHQPLF